MAVNCQTVHLPQGYRGCDHSDCPKNGKRGTCVGQLHQRLKNFTLRGGETLSLSRQALWWENKTMKDTKQTVPPTLIKLGASGQEKKIKIEVWKN